MHIKVLCQKHLSVLPLSVRCVSCNTPGPGPPHLVSVVFATPYCDATAEMAG